MKKALIILLLAITLLLSKFWIGIYKDDEFSSTHVFIKYRPIWKTYFYSPRGMSDLKLSDMSVIRQTEQKLFDEFVLKNIPTS